MQDQGDHRRPAAARRQDTFDLRDQIHPDNARYAQQQHYHMTSDSEHSVMEDSSDAEGEDGVMDSGQEHMELQHSYGAEHDHDLDGNDSDEDALGDYLSDSSSSLSIPNESIDFDLVYSLTNFAATVEGQASVVKGDSLFLMDDSNSYWWLVRVLKTQEVGYIPAENIETPFERLARLNRHRNVDLASATQAEAAMEDKNAAAAKSSRPRTRVQFTGSTAEGAATSNNVKFKHSSAVFRYPPAVWNEDDEDADAEWDEDEVEVEEAFVKDETGQPIGRPDDGGIEEVVVDEDETMKLSSGAPGKIQGEDTQMSWEEVDDVNAQTRAALGIPAPLRPGSVSPSQAGYQQRDEALATEGQQQQLRTQTSRERLLAQQQDQKSQAQPVQERRPIQLDPAEATDTKRLVITPAVAREGYSPSPQPGTGSQQQSGPLLPSAILQKQQQARDEERKRTREEIEAAEQEARKRAKGQAPGVQQQAQSPKELVRTASQETRSSVASGSGSSGSGGAKLRKERTDRDRERDRDTEDERQKETDKDGKEKKKKSGMFGGLFGRRKEKGDKEKGSKSSIENIAGAASEAGRARGSEESGTSSAMSHVQQYTASPPEGRSALSPSPGLRQQPRSAPSPQQAQQQAQQQAPAPPQASSPYPQSTTTTTPAVQQSSSAVPPQVSQHASQLRERDQQQQALYQKYLKSSPSSPPDGPSYATMSASLVMPNQSGSLNGSPNASGFGLGLAPGAAGFRTPGGRPGSLILSPSSGDIVVPELNVVRVFAGRNLQTEATFKTVLLNATATAADLVRQAMQRFRLAAGENAEDYYLTVKQVEGSTLRLEPNEKPLGVFEQLAEEALDLPKVKRSSMGSISSVASNLSAHPAIRKLSMNDFIEDSAVKIYLNRTGDGGDDSMTLDDEDTIIADSSHALDTDQSTSSLRGQFLSVSTSNISNVSPERFTSPSVRFALQLVIFPDELPDNMVFDPHTEAIVFKETLRDRSQSSATVNPGIPQNHRKKFFNFPKNITVAEVIELGLERFGILEGVVDGGDEVEDKLTKRRSTSRVRYILTVHVDGQDRELAPSSKVVDAFPRPPVFRRSGELKRRSIDSAHLLGSMDDVQSDDPVFVLRRATTYRNSAASRHRLSAPLDEIALSHLHRDSSASASSASDAGVVPDDSKARQPSRQEIIAAQRAASRANQKAMLSTQANGQSGVDVVLPDKGMLRSQRGDADSKMRYSYVQPDGETYDISEIVEEEFGASGSERSLSPSGSLNANNDLLSGAMNSSQPSALITRVLNKITGRNAAVAQSSSASTVRSTSPSMYSEDARSEQSSGSRAATPTAATLSSRQSPTPTGASRSRSVTPTAGAASVATHRQHQPSIESVLSDVSDYRTAASATPSGRTTTSSGTVRSPSPIPAQRIRIPKDEFGLTEMLAVIESKAALGRGPPLPPMDVVDHLYFGRKLDVEKLHPEIRNVFSGSMKKLEDLDSEIDNLLQRALSIM